MCRVNTSERLLMQVALVHEEQRVRQFIADCEALSEKDRRFPTDQPERWRRELDAILAVRAKLEEPRSFSATAA